MTRNEIIDGLKFTIEMFLLDTNTGETFIEPRNDMDKITVDACKGAIELLEQEPTADVVERKKGEWISHYDYCKKYGYTPSGLISLWWCDQCEQGAEHPTNFCPNCGADMRGDKDECIN